MTGARHSHSGIAKRRRLMLTAATLVLLVMPTWAAASTSSYVYCTVTVIASPDTDGDGLTDANEEWLATDPGDRDSDDDGMPDGWEVQYGLNPTNDADAAGNADGDGHNNREEYVAGTDPRDGGDYFAITAVLPVDATNIVFSWETTTSRFYSVLVTTNLISSSWTNALDPPYEREPGSGFMTLYTNTDQIPRRFFRVKVEE